MKIFKPIIGIALGLIFLAIFLGLFFILLKSAENKASKEYPNIEKKEHKLIE